jgi:TPR repeat protein
MLLFRDERSDEDNLESLDWYRRAAELGDSSGMVSMGLAYSEGRGVPVDQQKAIEWYIKAHDAGARNAAGLAGRILSYHSENHPEAVKWLRIAVENGDTVSYSILADIHNDQRSPAHDPEEAFRCWLQVAERPRGDLRFDAMYWLARSCRDGIGTVRNHDEAKRWLDRIIAVAPKEKSDYRHAVKLRRELDEELF